ncbi:MAG: valine--tRNA ligase [Rhodospirillales bacterium]|nr:valine--tRNA ligase [Rhodospirillales bacterium]
MLEKTYRPNEVEARHYAQWEKSGAFAANGSASGDPYTIMMPPPNVTGSLHIGHALTFTLQDILTRYNRMRGRDTLWQPGTDHAGIATQMVVERQLEENGISRHDLGRGGFVDKVWEWKAQSGNTITEQLRRLGASPDWARERFTLDDGLSEAVREVFVKLHQEGLIYRDKRLVNWDTKLGTAVSDLEVQQVETNGHLWHFKYPVEGIDNKHITIATTRPETMLGDSGIAVHPDDDRYKDLIGKNAILPIVGRTIKIVGDDYADPETGSGAVKITPAHDFNDFEVGKRHDLERINILDANGCLNDGVPEAYRGMDCFEARKKIVAEMERLGLVEKIEDHQHAVPHGDRSGPVLEPWLTDQWFVDAETLAGPAIKAVEDEKMRFVPKHWENTYFEWMRNIQPWCISRQIWWGHQIPAWYGPDGTVFVAKDEAGAQTQADAHYGTQTPIIRDPDVLDTWFSSALWPFSTLGWPEKTDALERYYPTDVLVTGFDIIFFWVARMVMMGLHFMDEVPFKDVYIHALVRDDKGQKMSKSKGNVVDPLELIDQYGCDSLRFTMCAMAAQGTDINLSEARVEGYRNFTTKLWNAARFAEMNECRPIDGFDPGSVTQPVNRWIITELMDREKDISGTIEAYRFNETANALYHFTWGSFCDWYLELIKPVLIGDDEAAKAETRATCAWVLDQILKMLHPVMPFVTEELWEKLGTNRQSALISADWPEFQDSWRDPVANDSINWLIKLVSEIRTVRSEMNVPAKAKIPLLVKDANGTTLERLNTHETAICQLARIETIDALDGDVPKGALQSVLDEATLILPIAGIIDLDGEGDRLKKEIAKAEQEMALVEKKLANKGFVEKAPEAVVAENRERLAEYTAQKEKLTEALVRLKSL